MRRLLCATALSGALVLLGACSSDEPAGPGATAAPDAGRSLPAIPAPGASAGATGSGSSGASGAKGGDAALKGNTAAICAQAAKTGGDAGKNFAQDLKLLIDAESAQDKDAVAKAKAKTDRDVENYSFALTDMSKLASDPELKAALAAMGKKVAALKGDVRKLDAEKLEGLQETLAKACGTA
ncbi:hypothetical protein Asp14428_30810 [Actinoplanes sp. NBRC 14428]|uniref:Small secreted protein n=1 Tax=Pseudosporangium ferrugineum TaxID=439699 RepID=A0A2T0RSE3_9ACTN|nr:hypothetical protein [Pseudosporangium ferrugineum]PRY24081.1 hypothetical protein CLV70_114214 [Pseudosporangium ferrugineum]BCJ51606.1 hypothetical protein Asp14428_30810 [Actinoplanes sp. NBRC 14428]